MAKKARTKGKDDDKPVKGGGNKPVKVVTFETPKPDSLEQSQHAGDWEVDDEAAVSGSPTWGETAGDGGWNNSSSGRSHAPAAGWTSPSSQPLPVPPQPRSPDPTSRHSRSLSVTPDASTTEVSQKAMLEEAHGSFQTWDPQPDSAIDHEWGSPLSNATTHIAPTSPLTQPHSFAVDPQSFSAVGVAMQNPKTQKFTSASEMARKNARTPAAPQPALKPPPPPPNLSAPASPAANAKRNSTLTAQQWTAWTKATPSSPPSSDRFGNRDDYAVVAAALDRDIKKTAAAKGHYPPKAGGWPAASQPSEWSDPPKGGGWNQQGKRTSTGWPQPDGDGWGGGAQKSNDAGWDARSKRKSGGGSGWSNGSEAGWSQSGRSGHHQPHKHQSHSYASSNHKPMKSWQAWGDRRVEDTEMESDDEDEEWVEEDDWYAEQPVNGGSWGGQDGGGLGDKSGGGWGGKGGGGGWDDKPGESSRGKGNGGWDTAGADRWTTNSGGWDQQHGGQGWGAAQGTWGGSKVITDPPENYGTRNALSPQQRSQILNSLLNNPQDQKSSGPSLRYPHGVTLTDNPMPRQSHKPESWGQNDGWGHDPGWGPIREEGEEDDTDVGDEHPQSYPPQKHDPWSNRIDDTSYSMPSKILAYAYKDTKTSLHQDKPRNSMHEYTSIQFVESHGTALQPVEQALFGKARWAKDRIHWMFPPDKDERVSRLLAWIESVSYQLGTFGLHKFLQSRERGALIVNAGFRLPEHPAQPVFDWLTFDQLQETMDKTMQESVVFYDPGTQVLVFVLLPSKSGNSVAMWRRKIKVPNNTRLMYQQHITQAVAGLKKELDYTVYVDRLPLKPEDPDKPKLAESAKTPKLTPKMSSKLSKSAPVPQKKKRKWWQIFK